MALDTIIEPGSAWQPPMDSGIASVTGTAIQPSLGAILCLAPKEIHHLNFQVPRIPMIDSLDYFNEWNYLLRLRRPSIYCLASTPMPSANLPGLPHPALSVELLLAYLELDFRGVGLT